MRRVSIREDRASRLVGQRVQVLYQLPVVKQGPCTVSTGLDAHDNGANGAICAGYPIPYGEHEDRRVQTHNGPERCGQIYRIAHRSIDDPQPDPRDILSVFRSRFPGEEKVVPVD